MNSIKCVVNFENNRPQYLKNPYNQLESKA